MTIMLTIKSAWSACVGVCPVSRHIHIEHAVSSWKDHGRNVDVRRYGWHGPTRIINMSGVLGGQGVWSLRATHDCAIGCRLSCCTTENPPWDYRFCHQHVTYPQATKHWPWEIPSFANLCSFFKNVSCQPSPEAKPLGFPSLGKFRSFSKINGDVHAFYPAASRS